jgi:uncharacterized iron-regulated membrane protein
MSPNLTRRLLAIHRICGLIFSLNMLLFSVTGVILIFHEEIDDALGAKPSAEQGTAQVTLANAVELARASKPGDTAVYVFQDNEEFPGSIIVGMSPGKSQLLAESKPSFVDATSGKVRNDAYADDSFTSIVLRLHAQLLLGPAGALLVGVIGLALLLSLGTGVLIYGPMMKRFVFGLLRRQRHVRTLVADVHKLLGVAAFGWTLVVTLTGTFLSIGSQLIQLYAVTELAALAAPYAGQPPVTSLTTLDEAVVQAERASGGRKWSMVALPGSDFASPAHYSVLLKGHSGLDSRMLTMGLVDATDPSRVDHRQFPWYLRALLVSEPLHFGDYAGMPLKIIWTLFTLITIAMAISGVWVSFAAWRDRSARRRSDAIDSGTAGVPS